MTLVPHALADWSAERIEALAASGLPENDRFDFKHDLQDAEGQRKTAAAFANNRGGFLIFGVTDRRELKGVRSREFQRNFGNGLSKFIEPSVEFAFAVPIALGGGTFLHVVEIFRGQRHPHAIFFKDCWCFYKRTAAGTNESMTPSEIASAYAASAKREDEIASLLGEIERIHRVARDLNIRAQNARWDLDMVLSRLDVTQLKPLVIYVRGSFLDRSLGQQLDELIDGCVVVDKMLARLETIALQGDQRGMNALKDPLKIVLAQRLPGVVTTSERLAKRLGAPTP